VIKIDSHGHILPSDWPDLASKYNVPEFPVLRREGNRRLIYRNGQFFREIWQNGYDPETRIAEYASHGIQVQVLSTVPVMFSYWAQPDQALDLARFLNDHIAGLVDQYPQHMIGLGTLPMQSPEHAISEINRCASLGLRGFQIGSHINDWNLDAPELFDVFAAMQDANMALMVHPWEMMGSESMPKYWLPWLVGMPAEQSRAICCMIFGGVLERLPKLRVCFAHGGGSFPYTLGRIEHGFSMRPDLVATDNDINPREYLDRIWVDSVVHDSQAMRYLIELMGAERIMLGSDYPFPLGEQKPGDMIERLNLPDADRQDLFHDTALRWLDMPLDTFTRDS